MARTRVSPITKTASYWPDQTANIYSAHVSNSNCDGTTLYVTANGLAYSDDDWLDGKYNILPLFIGYGQHAYAMWIGSRILLRPHNFGIHLRHLTRNLLVLERKSRV